MATQIRSCPLSRLTIGSASDFHTNVLAAITATTPTVLHIETLEPNYKQLVEQLASVVNRQRSYVSTKKLNELDDLRDNGSGFIFNVLDANKTCLIAAKVDAANRLLAQISAYRGMRNHEYSKQSAELRGMLAVLEAAENAADVETLSLGPEAAENAADVETLSLGPDIEALREVADEFEAAFKAKAAEASAHADQSDLDSKALASDAAKAYENIVQSVNAYAIVQPTDELLGFINEVNGLVEVYAQIANGSTSGGTSPEPAPGEDTGGEGTGGDGSDDGGTPGEV